MLRRKFLSSIPSGQTYLLRDRDSWRKHYAPRLDPSHPGRYPADWDERVQEWTDPNRERVIGLNAGSLYGWIRNWAGMENISLTAYDDPVWYEEMVETVTNCIMGTLSRALETGGHFDAMAEYMLFPRNAINYRVPASIPVEHATYIEPLACAIHAVQRAQIEFGDVVVIAGAGPLGLGMVAAARLKNPRLLIAIDLNDRRLEVARACGADLVLNPRQEDTVAEVRKLSGGYGCDRYIEASGHPSAVVQGLHMIRPLGTFVEFSVLREPVTVDWTIIGDQKELTIHGSHLGPYCYPAAMDMLGRGLLPVDQIITHRLPLTSFQEGMELVAAGQQSIKVALLP